MAATVAQKAHYQANKALYAKRARVNTKRYIERNRVHVKAIKEASPCMDCKISWPAVAMDFDHVSDDKEKTIAVLVRNGSSIARIDREIAKCELVCACCHRLRTAKRALMVER